MKAFDEQMTALFEKSLESSFKSLFKKNEKFYYFSFLIDEGIRPYISAWSYEALERVTSELGLSSNLKLEYKYSPCDSPYCAYEHDSHFSESDEMLESNDIFSLSDEEFDKEFDLRLNSMEEAMKRLDCKGFFGFGDDRKKIIITVEVVPPDWTNTTRIKRLNPESNIEEWLELCSESEE